MRVRGFVTIDDLIQKTEELLLDLSRLGEYKHPLDVRRASSLKFRKVVNDMVDQSKRESKQIKGGSQTYFIDVETTRDGSRKYLKITASKMKGKDGKPERASIYVWPEEAKEFAEAVSEMAKRLD